MRKDRPKLVDQYAVQFVIGAGIAINFVPWFFEPFGMLLSEPLEAARLLFGRALLAGIIIGIFVAVRRYGWVSTALFFLNPTLAFGWVRARGKLADKLTEVTSRPRPTRKPVERKVTEPKQAAPRAPWTKSDDAVPTSPPPAPMPVQPRSTPIAIDASSPVRSKKARHVSDLGPKRGDHFAESPIHTCRRGMFG